MPFPKKIYSWRTKFVYRKCSSILEETLPQTTTVSTNSTGLKKLSNRQTIDTQEPLVSSLPRHRGNPNGAGFHSIPTKAYLTEYPVRFGIFAILKSYPFGRVCRFHSFLFLLKAL